MKSVIAQGADNSFIRFIQENPEIALDYMKAFFRVTNSVKPDLASITFTAMQGFYQEKMGTSLPVPFDINGNNA